MNNPGYESIGDLLEGLLERGAGRRKIWSLVSPHLLPLTFAPHVFLLPLPSYLLTQFPFRPVSTQGFLHHLSNRPTRVISHSLAIAVLRGGFSLT